MPHLAAERFSREWSNVLDRLHARFERALSNGLEVRSDHGVAGRRLSFVGASTEALEALTRPVKHLALADPTGARLSVEIGHGADAEVDTFLRLSPCETGNEPIRPRLLLGDGTNTLGTAWPASGMLGIVDRPSQRAVVWLRDPERVGIADAATLIRALVAWSMADCDCGVVHAAAVAGARGAALLAGRGGTGKSSTAAACFQHGLRFIGDDSVLCRADTTMVFSLNTYASLFATDVGRYYTGLGVGVAAEPGRDGKVAVDLARVDPDRTVAQSPLCAIVSLTRPETGHAELRPAARARVLASLAPSSVFNVPTPEQATLSMIAALVRRVPTYELVLGGNRDEAAMLLQRFLDDEVAA